MHDKRQKERDVVTGGTDGRRAVSPRAKMDMRLAVLLTLLGGPVALWAPEAMAQTLTPLSSFLPFSISQNGSVFNVTSVGSGATPLPGGLQINNTGDNGAGANGTLTVDIAAGNPPAVVSGQPLIYQFLGFGAQDVTSDTSPGVAAIGPAITVNNAATLTEEGFFVLPGEPLIPDDQFSPLSASVVFPTEALFVESTGANGFAETAGTSQAAIYNGGAGGAITITNSGSITVNALPVDSGEKSPVAFLLGSLS
jgi:hypothetical protein